MEVSIKTIKITFIISVISLVVALVMGLECFDDTSKIYLLGISWITIQNTAFAVFGSAVLATVSAFIIYCVEKEAYLKKTEQYLINVCGNAKNAFIQINEASKVLENKILSNNEKPTFMGVSTIISSIKAQQGEIEPATIVFLFKHSQVVSFNALLCRCYECVEMLVAQKYKLEIKYGQWEINDNINKAAQSSSGLKSLLLDEAKSCSEEDLRLTINQISWQLNNVIQCSMLALHQLYYLKKKEDKLKDVYEKMDDRTKYYQKTIEIKAPTVDKETIAKHQIKIIQQISTVDSLLSDPFNPVISVMKDNPYSYINALTESLKNMRAAQYEVRVLYASDKKLIFDVNKIVENLNMIIEQTYSIVNMVSSLQSEWICYLQKNGVDVNTVNIFDSKMIELSEIFLKEKTPYAKVLLLGDEIIKIIRSDEFKERLNFNTK